MRQLARALLTCLALVARAPAAQDAEVQVVLDKALRALGGEARLARLQAATWKGTVTVHGLGKPVVYTGDWTVQPPEQVRVVATSAVNGKKVERLMVVNGDKGWVRQDGVTQTLEGPKLAEEKERLYAAWVDTVSPLTGPDFDLGLLGDARIGKRTTIGIRVACAGHRDVELYFDKASGLPVRSTTRRKDPRTGKETSQEVFYDDYKDFDGVKRATRITVKVNRRTTVEGVITDFKPRKKLDESAFAKPR